MRNSDYAVFDFETGGLDCNLNPVLEVAMFHVDRNSFKIKDRLEFLVKPYDDLVIDKQALKVNGLKISQLNEEGVSKKEMYNRIKTSLRKWNPGTTKFTRPVLVGHNVNFDIDFLDVIFKSFKDDYRNYVAASALDTQLEVKKLEILTELNLKACCEYFGIEIVNAHRAGGDVEATVKLLAACVNRFRSSSSSNSKNSEKKEQKSRIKFQFTK